MKKLLLIGLLLGGFIVNAQADLKRLDIKILPESELIIAGSTNVNKFDCKFNMNLIRDTREVKYIREDKYLTFQDLVLQFETTGFDCGHKRMNSDFQDLLMCDTYPVIEIQIDRIETFPGEFSKAYITVKLAGKTNKYDLPVKVDQEYFIGKFEMNIRDFGLEPPKKALGLIEVDEEIQVLFDLKLSME